MDENSTLLEALEELGISVTKEVKTITKQVKVNSSVNDVLTLGAILFVINTDVCATNGTIFKWKHVLAVFPQSTTDNAGKEVFPTVDFTYWQSGQSNYSPQKARSFGFMGSEDLAKALIVENVAKLPGDYYPPRPTPVVRM